jgi:DNA polymerase-3 subunit epsilon
MAASLTDAPLVFVDVETTGLDPARGDRVCEIALIRQEKTGTRYEWTQLVDPDRAVSPGAFAVNRISRALLDGAPRFAAVIPEINDIAHGAVWVAHNAPFDLGFLQAEYRRARRVFVERPVIDTVHLARRHFRFRSNGLSALASEFGVNVRQAHRALGDCRTTLAVFESIIEKAFGADVPNICDLTLHADRMRLGSDLSKTLPPTLEQMLSQSADLEIVYLSSEGIRTSRRVTVLEVVQGSHDLYLVAHCHMRGEDRTFRLDRIVDWKATSHP